MVREQRFKRNLHDPLAEHDKIVPEAQLLLHLLEAAGEFRRELVPLHRGHLQCVPQDFSGDAKGVGILPFGSLRGIAGKTAWLGMRGAREFPVEHQTIGALGEGIDLQMQ